MKRKIAPIRPAELALSGILLLLLGAAALSSQVAAAGDMLQHLSGPFLLALEWLFWIFTSNEAILAVSGVVLALAALRGPLTALSSRLPYPADQLVHLLLTGFLAMLLLLGQAYLLAFALLAHRIYLGAALLLGIGAGLAVWKLRGGQQGEEEPTLADVPAPLLVALLGAYLFLGMVQGHLATPVVHAISAAMADLSARSPFLYRLAALLILALPLSLWLPRLLPGLQPRARKVLVAAATALLLCAALPTAAAITAAGLLCAACIGATLAIAGFAPLRLAHPDPRRLMARLLAISLLGANATAVHYLDTMWRDPGDAPHPAVRRVSTSAGAFSLGLTTDGRTLLASLREPRRIVAVDLAGPAAERTVLDLGDTPGGTGHLLSWTEPENLLRLGNSDVFLLLQAVSDDQERNQVVRLTPGGETRPLAPLHGKGISDLTSDGRGRVYLSTEFNGAFYVMDEATLDLLGTVQWPDAETNRLLVLQPQQRAYSVGLWSDPYLREMDLNSRQETDRLRVGTLSWDMDRDARTGRLYLPKFITGQVLVVSPRPLNVEARWEAGFGARAVAVDPGLRLLYTGAMYAGTVSVFSLDSGKRLHRFRLGGHIKRIHLDPRTHRAYVGSDCGIFELDGLRLAGALEAGR